MIDGNSKKIVFIATVPHLFDTQLGPLFSKLNVDGWIILCVSNKRQIYKYASFKKINIKRKINIILDFICLFELIFLLLLTKADIIHTFTPKGGLIGQLSAIIAFKKNRIHTFTGQVWLTKKGIIRYILKFMDKIIGLIATECYCDSESQRDFLISQGIINRSKITVLGKGSLCGVDLSRFNYCENNINREIYLSKYNNYNPNNLNIIFVGRICDDKGVKTLLGAYDLIGINKVNLFLAGEFEEDKDFYLNEFIKLRVNYIGYTNEIEKIYSMMDILVLPSKREGFGSVVIEANACGVVAIGSNIQGLCDSIQHSVTGILIDDINQDKLALEIDKLINDQKNLKYLKHNALYRVKNHFDSKIMVNNLLRVYNKCIE
jgi:glycosyltransferase involved in cell wall biosynthesis